VRLGKTDDLTSVCSHRVNTTLNTGTNLGIRGDVTPERAINEPSMPAGLHFVDPQVAALVLVIVSTSVGLNNPPQALNWRLAASRRH
jgi:hypothetical protein